MKIKAPYFYLTLIAWLIVLIFLLNVVHFNTTGLGVTLAFLTLIFVPGFSLWRLTRLGGENLALKLLYIIGFGFGFYFLANFLTLIFGLTLTFLINLSFFAVILIFVLAVYVDRQAEFTIDLDWFKKQRLVDYLFFALVIGGSVIGFFALDAQSDKLIGDGYFHLAILQKIVSAQNLNPYNLWVTKTTTLNPVYSFPVWHILVGEIAKLLKINIFTAYIQILLPLVILNFIVAFAFIKIIFKERYLTLIIYLAYLVLLLSGVFYTLIPLRSPDSLNRLLLLPMVLGLTIDYLFSKNVKIIPQVVLVAMLVIFMGLVHFTQLIDYFLILFIFLGLFLIISRELSVLKRFGWLMLALFGLTLPYLLIFQRENIGQLLIGNAAVYSGDKSINGSYHNANIIVLYTIFSLPILALFIKQKSRLIFLISIPIALITVSWQIFGLRGTFLKYLGEIFTIRAVTDIPVFVFWGVILYVVIAFFSFILAKLPKLIQGFLCVLLAILTFAGLIFFKSSINYFIDEIIFNAKNLFFYENFWPIFVIISALSITIYFIVRFYQKKEIVIPEIKNKFIFIFLTFLLFLILSWPYWPVLSKTLDGSPNGSIITNREITNYGDIQRIGGKQTVEFLKELPSSSVVAFPNVTVSQIVSLYSKGYNFEYPYGITDFTLSKTIYDPELNSEQRLQFLEANSIDYVITLKSSESDLYNNSPYFQKVFENHYIYQTQTKASSYQKEGEFVVFKVFR